MPDTSIPAILTVRLAGRDIGTLTRLPGESIVFAFNNDYIGDEQRPTLSWGFYDAFRRLRTKPYIAHAEAPAFFANLLPEAHLREYTAHRAALARNDDFGLLWVTGEDLPGAVTLHDPENRPLPPPAQGGPPEPPPLEQMFRFSLAGVQLKFSAIQDAIGGFTIRTHGDKGDHIVKLPSTHFDHVPEGEYAMLQFARQVGIRVPSMRLIPIDNINGLPDEARSLHGFALAIDRFDRPEPGVKVHIEDFNQIYKQRPDQKYDNYAFADIAQTVYQAIGTDALIEFIHRLVFNIAIANNDMHLKNWSFIYPDGRSPQLAPAYDYVCTKAYLQHNQTGLALGSARFFPSVTLEQFERLASRAGLSPRVITHAASDMVERMTTAWPSVRETMPFSQLAQVVEDQMERVPLFSSRAAPAPVLNEPPNRHEELS